MGNRKNQPVLVMPCGRQRSTAVFKESPKPRREVAMVFQALRTLASTGPLESSMSGLSIEHFVFCAQKVELGFREDL